MIYIEDKAILVSGHLPLLNMIASWILVGMLIYLSLPDIGLLGLMWLTVLAFVKARTLLRVLSNTFSWFLTVLTGILALHSSTAALLSSFRGFFLTWSLPLYLLRKCVRFTFTYVNGCQMWSFCLIMVKCHPRQQYIILFQEDFTTGV